MPGPDLSLRFITAVWSKQPHWDDEAHLFLSTKDWDSGDWTDHAILGEAIEIPDDGDLYFCPNLFSDDRRLRKNALNGRWLYADLDEVNPRNLTPAPTLAWETSHRRYQALWLLDRPIPPRALEKLNQRLTYFTGADKGGWSLTKVLRVPGSVSHKREKPFTVRLLNLPRTLHQVEDMMALLRDVEVIGDSPATPLPHHTDLPDRDETYRKHRKAMGQRARQLINTSTVVRGDDRSARLWELENILLDKGLTPEEVLVIVQATAWNKFKGQRRELKILWTEINKAKANRAAPTSAPKKKSKSKANKAKQERAKKRRRRTPDPEGLPDPVTFRDFMTKSLPKPSWLVEGIWSESAHGLLAGDPKTFKTLFLLDLSVSIASGTPFLGRFPVPRTGPVMIIQEENTPGDMQDRLMRISGSRGVGPTVAHNGKPSMAELDFGHNLPIHLLNNQGFSFTDEEWMVWLERQIRKIRPVLVAFDPLYLIAKGIDENSATEMTPILSNLLRLKQKYGCGILIVHHFNKGTAEPGAKRQRAKKMSGTGVFHRWLASAIYVERADETEPIVKITGEHRSHGSGGAFRVEFDLGTEEDLHYEAEVDIWHESDPDVSTDAGRLDLTDIIAAAKSTGSDVTVAEAAEELGVTPTAVRNRARRNGITVAKKRIDGKLKSVLLP